MKIRSMQTCIMSSLPRCIFRCSVFRYVTLVSFFFQTLLFNCNSFTLVANKYLLTYLLEENSHILHCCDNLVATATANNCIFSLVVYSLFLKIYLRGYSVHTSKYKALFFSYGLSLRGLCVKVRASYL